MTPRWHFEPLNPASKARDPVQGEFFASESIEGPAA